MLCLGLQTLDELDIVEKKEKQEQEAKAKKVVLVAEKQLALATSVFLFFSLKELLAFEAPS